MQLRAIALLSCLALSGCDYSYSLGKTQERACFEIISPTEDTAPNSPIMLDKCTGETWVILRVTEPLEKGETVPGFSYTWYKIERYGVINSVAGR